MADIKVPKSDKGYYLEFTVQDASGNAKDLTGYTVSFKAWKPGKPDNPIVNATCEVTNTTGGLCRYLVATADFVTEGTFSLELEMTAVGVAESTDNYTVEVQESA